MELFVIITNQKRSIKMKIDTQEIINFIFYLEDKVDSVYSKEVRRNVNNFVTKLKSI